MTRYIFWVKSIEGLCASKNTLIRNEYEYDFNTINFQFAPFLSLCPLFQV
jgi:hypothetical protein